MRRILLWNVQFARCGASIQHVASVLEEKSIDVACLTESTADYFSDRQYVIRSTGDYGYSNQNGKRQKVTLWSREPWAEVNYIGDPLLPAGRFLSGVSQGIRFIGICVPWSMAHVTSGLRNKKKWEDHRAYLAGLANVIDEYGRSAMPLCLLGDFNQRIPTTRYYSNVFSELEKALGSQVQIHTKGIAGADGRPLIDHVGTNNRLRFQKESVIEKQDQHGNILSDHIGVIGKLHFTSFS